MTNSNKFDTHESFYHGLIKSKLWLCEVLETTIYRECLTKPSLHILGCWDNLLAFMLLTRKPTFYNTVHGYDINPEAISNAKLIPYDPSNLAKKSSTVISTSPKSANMLPVLSFVVPS